MINLKDFISIEEKKEVILPKVYIKRPKVFHALEAFKLAKKEFGDDPTNYQIMICKMIIQCEFDGKTENLEFMQTLPESFILKIAEAMEDSGKL